jgi:MSHA biogenesis protein MshN
LAGLVWTIRHDKPVRVPQPASQAIKPAVAAKPNTKAPPAVPQSSPAETAGAQQTEDYSAPSLNLSFELSSIPLPSSQPAPQHEAPATQGQTLEKREQAPVKRRSHIAQEKTEAPPMKTEVHEGYGGPPIKHISPQQQAQDEFNQALALIQQGRKSEALPHLETTLQLDPDLAAARQTLVGLLLESGRNADAERLLQEGLRHDPRQANLAMLLARLQIERGALQQALDTLDTTMPFADQQPSYHAFVAAVLQRLDRHKEAITHYQIALHLAPNSAIWWMGLGISQQAVDDDEDARTSFQHALNLHQLNAELQAFVEKRLQQLAAPPKKN